MHHVASPGGSAQTHFGQSNICAPAPNLQTRITTMAKGVDDDPQRSFGTVSREGSEGGRPAVHGFSRPVAALHHSGRASSTRTSSRTAWASTAPASAAGRRSTRATCSWCRSPRRPFSIRSRRCPTLSMICNIQDPITREDYTRDPRNVARKAVNYLKSTGIADTCYIGPEAEFFIFDDVRFDQNAHEGYYYIDSIEGRVEPRPRREARTWATSCATRKATSRCRRPTSDEHPQRDDADDDRLRHGRRGPAPRGGHRRPGRDRHALHRPGHAWPTR